METPSGVVRLGFFEIIMRKNEISFSTIILTCIFMANLLMVPALAIFCNDQYVKFIKLKSDGADTEREIADIAMVIGEQNDRLAKLEDELQQAREDDNSPGFKADIIQNLSILETKQARLYKFVKKLQLAIAINGKKLKKV